MAAVSSLRLKAFYLKLCFKGKKAKIALVAMMPKLLSFCLQASILLASFSLFYCLFNLYIDAEVI